MDSLSIDRDCCVVTKLTYVDAKVEDLYRGFFKDDRRLRNMAATRRNPQIHGFTVYPIREYCRIRVQKTVLLNTVKQIKVAYFGEIIRNRDRL